MCQFVILITLRVVEGADPYITLFAVDNASLLEGGGIFAENDGRRKSPPCLKEGGSRKADGRIRLLLEEKLRRRR